MADHSQGVAGRPVPKGNEVNETRPSLFDRLKSTQTDDREIAWSEFMARYAPIVSGFARRCGASPQDTDDVVQEVMTVFFSVSGEFAYDRSKGRFRGWLKTTTVRAAIRKMGKDLRFRGTPLEEIPQLELAIEPLWADVWEQQLVAVALDQLRQESGRGVTFRAFEQHVLLDRPAEIVAHELNTTVENVYQAKSRLTRKLRELVGHLRDTD